MATVGSEIPGSQLTEEWRDVVGWEGYYQVSNLGRVKRLFRLVEIRRKCGMIVLRKEPEAIMKNGVSAYGYHVVILQKNRMEVVHHAKVHRLVAQAFIPNPDGLPIINHKDRNRTNNLPSNLEWCDYKHNLRHSRDTFGEYRGEKHSQARLTESQVREIRVKAANGDPVSKLSREYGVGHGQIGKIIRRERWQHVA